MVAIKRKRRTLNIRIDDDTLKRLKHHCDNVLKKEISMSCFVRDAINNTIERGISNDKKDI